MIELPDETLPPGTKICFKHVYPEDSPWFIMNGMICTVCFDDADLGALFIEERPLGDTGMWPRRNFRMIDNFELDGKQYDAAMEAINTYHDLLREI